MFTRRTNPQTQPQYGYQGQQPVNAHYVHNPPQHHQGAPGYYGNP